MRTCQHKVRKTDLSTKISQVQVSWRFKHLIPIELHLKKGILYVKNLTTCSYIFSTNPFSHFLMYIMVFCEKIIYQAKLHTMEQHNDATLFEKRLLHELFSVIFVSNLLIEELLRLSDKNLFLGRNQSNMKRKQSDIKKNREEFHEAGMSLHSSVLPIHSSGLIKSCQRAALPTHTTDDPSCCHAVSIYDNCRPFKKTSQLELPSCKIINKWFKGDEAESSIQTREGS